MTADDTYPEPRLAVASIAPPRRNRPAPIITIPIAAPPRRDPPNCLLQVGAGRGFVAKRELIVTAAHCLPHLPPCGALSLEDRTYSNLLGPLGGKCTVSAELLYADPVADLAVLGAPDDDEFDEALAGDYAALLETLDALVIAAFVFRTQEHRLPDGKIIEGPPKTGGPGNVITPDGTLMRCELTSAGRSLWVLPQSVERIALPGTPILNAAGDAAIGLVSTVLATHPYLVAYLPAWLTTFPRYHRTVEE